MLAEFTARLETKIARWYLADVFFKAFCSESDAMYLTRPDEDYFRRMLSVLKEQTPSCIILLLGYIPKESKHFPNVGSYVAMVLDAIDDESLEDKNLDFFTIVKNRNVDVIRALLERKAHPSMRQHYSDLIFSRAIEKRRSDVADLVRARVDLETIRYTLTLNDMLLNFEEESFLVTQYTLLCQERFKDVVSLGKEFIIGVMRYLCARNIGHNTIMLGKLGHELYKLQRPPKSEKRKTSEEDDGDESNAKRRKFEDDS